MAKRKANARTRKAARKRPKAARPATARSARKAAAPTPRRPAVRASNKSAKSTGRARTTAAGRAARSAPRKTKARKAAVARTRGPAATRSAARPKPAALERERRRLNDAEETPGAPSTLGYAAKASGAESGQAMYQQRKREHTEGGSALTGGDVDADWSEAYASGEETPGGDMPTPDQDVVEEIGRALGVEYNDTEELKGADKIEQRDKHRWEYDPASAEDYNDRQRKE